MDRALLSCRRYLAVCKAQRDSASIFTVNKIHLKHDQDRNPPINEHNDSSDLDNNLIQTISSEKPITLITNKSGRVIKTQANT